MALSLSLLFALLLCCRFPEPSAAGTAAKATLDPALSSGHRFDGVGGVSGGGGGTRLLLDYDEPGRSEILDYLFKPGYGASLQVLKVEIGCDGDTTQGAEQTHMRTPDDESPTRFDRGYENWLMVSTKLLATWLVTIVAFVLARFLILLRGAGRSQEAQPENPPFWIGVGSAGMGLCRQTSSDG